MSDETSKEGVIVDALKDVYRDKGVDEYWETLREKHLDLSSEELLIKFESGSTCPYSFFCRESNILVLAEEVVDKNGKDWQILCVGCGRGPEPYELAMRLLQLGKRNFRIDGIDVSREAIAEAKKGEIIHDVQWDSKVGNFLQKMEADSLINKTGKPTEPSSDKRRLFRRKKEKVLSRMTRETRYRLSDSVRSRMDFFTHDIINKPFGQESQYNIVVCNTVLQHYPRWTRELILTHILHSLEDGGILVLERNESLHGFGMTPDRYAWLKPYYEWKEDLSEFGLIQGEIRSEKLFVPTIFYRYDASRNQYKGKKMAIRDRKLVEISGD